MDLVECEWLPYITMPDGSDQPAPYLNFALSNDAVILPTVESRLTTWPLVSLQTCFRTEKSFSYQRQH